MDTQQTYAAYLPHIRKRWEAEQKGWQERRRQAWIVARQIATMLRDTFGAEEVVAYGSLAGEGPFDERSDIDLAVSGVKSADFFRAYAQAMSLSPAFEVDLIDLADCTQQLREAVLRGGVQL